MVKVLNARYGLSPPAALSAPSLSTEAPSSPQTSLPFDMFDV